MIYWQLFLSYFQIGLFSFGGGYACMPLIEHEVIHNHGWLTMAQFSDMTAISQMTPGPIALNIATFVGMQIAGVLGAIVAVIGCILPSCIILSALIYGYRYFEHHPLTKCILQALSIAMVAMIMSSGVSLAFFVCWQTNALPSLTMLKQTDMIGAGIFLVSLVTLHRFKQVTPTTMMIISGVLGFIAYSFC